MTAKKTSAKKPAKKTKTKAKPPPNDHNSRPGGASLTRDEMTIDFIDRLEALDDRQVKAMAEHIQPIKDERADLMSDIKEKGFDKAAIRQIIAERRFKRRAVHKHNDDYRQMSLALGHDF